MVLNVYADESAITGKIIVISGYMGTPDDWGNAVKRWRIVLKNYRVKHFHFRQFNSKDDCDKPSSPYYKWSWKKRDGFFYDLAMSIGQSLIPVGCDYDLERHRNDGLTMNHYETLFKMFFQDVALATSRHFPQMTSHDRILFVCDGNPNKKWTDTFKEVHASVAKAVPIFGGLAFEDDERPAHCGLQLADYLAAIFRQNVEEKRKTGAQRKPRIIDIIVFRNLGAPEPSDFNFAAMPQPIFETMIEAMRMDEQRQKKEWLARGVNRKYYPHEHADSIRSIGQKIAHKNLGKVKQWMQDLPHIESAFGKRPKSA
jgi:hypothetical protein